MKHLAFVWISVIQTLLRMLPFPCRTGLIKVGNPDRDTPVLLTCNFRLTVERVKRALRGIDAYLLVANSRGVNVWCAATGGLLTNHDVVSVLKTSGIEGLVEHRQVVLPQLAATGVEGKVIEHKTGWKVIWGPVYADAIPAFLRAGCQVTTDMRTVTFPWPQRFEMALAWAFPISLLTLSLLAVWPAAVLPLAAFAWVSSFVVFLSFPLYERRLHATGKKVGFVFFDFGRRGVPLLLWILFMLALVSHAVVAGEFSWTRILGWGLCSLVVLLLLCIDLTGSTPVYKSGLHEDRRLQITLDLARCTGAGLCQQVCPRDVFDTDRAQHTVKLARATRCVQCGACIVQCPCDALCFTSPEGLVVTAKAVRTFKLNLLGRRSKK